MARHYLGVDYGHRRVGIALGDDDTRLAQPLVTLTNDDQLAEHLAALIAEHSTVAVVVGLPRNLEGEETAQTALVRAFAHEVLAPLDCPVEFQDEALTSEAVIQRLRPTKDQVQDGLVDREAAAMILQDYLDLL